MDTKKNDKKPEIKSNGPVPLDAKIAAIDQLRRACLEICDHVDGIQRVVDDRGEILRQAGNELKAAAKKRFDMLTMAAEDQLGKSATAIETFRELHKIVSGDLPSPPTSGPESVVAIEALEAALQHTEEQLGAGKDKK